MNCSEAQEVKVEEGGGGSVFRVRVSLERYFSDERARCYMSVSRTRPVKALARRLRRAFRLPRPFALISRGYLLPPDEPLALLHPDDPVEVIPVKSTEQLVFDMNEDSRRPSLEVSSPRPPLGTATPLAADEPDRVVESDPPSAPCVAPAEPCVAPAEPCFAPAEPGIASTDPTPLELSEWRAASVDLEDMKRCALKLLDEQEEPPRRRRRVRRRRRAPPALPPAPPAVPVDEQMAIEPEGPATERSRTPVTERSRTPVTERSRTPVTERSRTPVTERSRTPAPVPPVVVRNGVTSPRAARLVRPLTDPAYALPAPALVPSASALPPPTTASVPPNPLA